MRSTLLMPLVARCIETIDACIWHMLVFMSVVVIVWGCGNVCCVAAVGVSVCIVMRGAVCEV